jgi:hypothetical protein
MSSSSAIPAPTFEDWQHDVEASVGYLTARLGRLKEANKQDGIRGRDLALAITNIEQGLFWLRSATESIARHRPTE